MAQSPEAATLTNDTIKGMLDALGASYTSIESMEIAGQVVYQIRSEDGRALIGPHGDGIHAIDFLVKKIIERNRPDAPSDDLHFLVDVNEYRIAQIRELQQKALMLAERARSFQYDVELSPMSAYERLIVHATLSGAPNVKTESQGEGRNRRVVIKYTAE